MHIKCVCANVPRQETGDRGVRVCDDGIRGGRERERGSDADDTHTLPVSHIRRREGQRGRQEWRDAEQRGKRAERSAEKCPLDGWILFSLSCTSLCKTTWAALDPGRSVRTPRFLFCHVEGWRDGWMGALRE